MTKADLSSWEGGELLPPEITHPENVQKLRELTTELEMKIERALRSLFTSSVMPWEQWFINAIANPDNRAALGIPNNLEKVDISHLLGGREGFHETFRRTNLERLGIIIAESLRTIVSNPLAGAGLTPFKETIETLSKELLRELRWNEFDYKLKSSLDCKLKKLLHKPIEKYTNEDNSIDIERLLNELVTKFNDLSERKRTIQISVILNDFIEAVTAILPAESNEERKSHLFDGLFQVLSKRNLELSLSWKDIEELTYGFWHSYKDPAMNVVLDFLTRARYDKGMLPSKYNNYIFKAMKVVNPKQINSCLTLLWALSVFSWSGKKEAIIKLIQNIVQDDTPYLTSEEPFINGKKGIIETLGVLQEFKDKKYIQQVIAVPAAIEICAYLVTIDEFNVNEANPELPIFLSNLKKLLCHVLVVNNGIHDGKKPLKESDWGHLYFMCNKLDALYSFWTWYYADLLTHATHKFHKIGNFWYSDIVFSKVEDIEKEKKSFANKCEFEETMDREINGLNEDEREKEKKRVLESFDISQCDEVWDNKKRIKGIEHSVLLLGGAGFGKTELLKQIYTQDETDSVPKSPKKDTKRKRNSIPAKIIQLTPLSFVKTRNFSDTLAVYESKVKHHHKCVVFIDELHIETQPSIYALLLVPLGEGVKNETSDGKQIIPDCDLLNTYKKCAWKENNELNIHFVFASSRFQTKREFLEEAFISKNTAMRDFATRVKHWVELPGFSMAPEQKLALFGKDLLDDNTKANGLTLEGQILIIKKGSLDVSMARKFLDLTITSTREFVTTKTETVKKHPFYYPQWLWKYVESLFNVV